MMQFSRLFALSMAFSSLFAVSACTSVDTVPNSVIRSTMLSTQSFPKGYKYQDDTPISTPAPSSPWVKSAVISDTEKMSSNTAAWQGAVYELVAKMQANLPKDGTPINLSSSGYSLLTSADSNSLDHYLRQALIQNGYNLTTVPDAGLKVVHHVERAKTPKTYNISMSVLDPKGNVLGMQSVAAVLPQ
jgi:hypothetical protein